MSLALSVTQPAPTCSEHDLVAAVRRGDDRAFEELYNRYRRRIGAYIYGMVADHGRAEDITQEVFISALRRMRDSERPIAFKPWIYEIAKNACIDDFRRARRAREVPIAGDDELEHDNPRLVAQAVTPEAAIESRQQLTDLRGAFRGLSESHHRIIVLRELEGLSYTEIGEQMGMSRPVVESTLFRARRRLSEEYEELVSGRRCDHVQTVISEPGSRAVRSLGIKEKRLVARHLAHCQPCRRHAHLTGFDESGLQIPGVVGKIAAFLPVPAFLRLRRGAAEASAGAGRAVASRAHTFNALQSAQSVANAVDPTGPFAGMGRVAAGAAALVIAGAGGGIVTGLATNSSPHRSTGATAAVASRGGTGASRGIAAAAGAGSRGAGVASGAVAGSASGPTSPGLAANSTSGAALRVGAGAPRSSGRVQTGRRPSVPLEPGTPTATRASANPGSGSGGGGSIDTAGLSNVASGVTSGVGGVTSGVTSGVTKLLPTGLPSTPSLQIPSVSLPAIHIPGIPLPSKKTGTSNPLNQGLQSGVTVTVPDPASVVAPLMNKLGLG